MFKKKIIFSLIFLLFLGILSFTFLPTTSALAGGIAIPATTGLPDPADTSGHGQGPVVSVALTVMGWILGIFMLLSIIAFVYTGIMYLTSRGDQYQAESAKKSLVYVVIGVFFVGAALVLLNTIDSLIRQ